MRRAGLPALVLSLLVVAGLLVAVATPTQAADVGRISATVETAPMHNGADAADDPAIWINPTDASKSTIIGTDKSDVGGGLVVYDLSGRELFSYPDGRMNNVDVRYDFPLGNARVSLVGVTNRVRSLDFYKVNVADGSLTKAGSFAPGSDITTPRGFAFYHSPVTGKFFAYVSDSGKTEQWELDGSSGSVKGRLVRKWTLSGPLHSEGLVADDEMKRIYLAQEDIGGIWRYGAEPGDPTAGTNVVSTTENGGEIGQDIKGITIYYGSGGRGYLLAASQGTNTFHAYTRDDNRPLGSFEIVDGNGVDAVTGTDGIDVTNLGVGGPFPQGFFVTQDTKNDVGNQNFKLVPWQSIASAYAQPLLVDPTYNAYASGNPSVPTPTPTPTPPRPRRRPDADHATDHATATRAVHTPRAACSGRGRSGHADDHSRRRDGDRCAVPGRVVGDRALVGRRPDRGATPGGHLARRVRCLVDLGDQQRWRQHHGHPRGTSRAHLLLPGPQHRRGRGRRRLVDRAVPDDPGRRPQRARGHGLAAGDGLRFLPRHRDRRRTARQPADARGRPGHQLRARGHDLPRLRIGHGLPRRPGGPEDLAEVRRDRQAARAPPRDVPTAAHAGRDRHRRQSRQAGAHRRRRRRSLTPAAAQQEQPRTPAAGGDRSRFTARASAPGPAATARRGPARRGRGLGSRGGTGPRSG